MNKKLEYISKSKKGTFDACPLAFKYNYIDHIEQEENPFFKVGIDVHTFIDNFFDIVSVDGNSLSGISEMGFAPNTSYKKNVVKFELERWEVLFEAGFDESFFYPKLKEKKWITERPKLIGIVDRVHKCCSIDVFAPKHPEFKDGDLVIVENKTGKPTAEKCKKYKNDMLWYKILIEIVHPEFDRVKWGAIYFPYDNYVYHYKLEDEDCRALAKEIRKTREDIIKCYETENWEANPSKFNCMWCAFKSHCKTEKGDLGV